MKRSPRVAPLFRCAWVTPRAVASAVFACAAVTAPVLAHDAPAKPQPQVPVRAAPDKAPIPAPPAAAPAVRRGVLTVRITSQDHDYKAPWNKTAPRNRAFTAVAVPGPYVLMVAAGLGQETLVEAQRPGDERRFDARVKRVDHETSLALVEVPDPAFWKDVTPLSVADDVPVEGEVTLARWLGNNQFEAATGVVRQVRSGDHGVGRADSLTLDVATTMANGGNGEPILKDGRMVGLATGRMEGAVSALGAPVLAQFLREAIKPTYRGVARRGVGWQKLLNPALRAHLGLKAEDGGVLVTRVVPQGSAAGVLQRGDVLLSVNGFHVDESGQVQHPRYGKISFGVLFTLGVAPGDKIPVELVRKGQRQVAQLTLKALRPEDDRVESYIADRPPEFALKGGLVFQPLTIPYLRTFGDWRRRGPLPLGLEADLHLDEPLPSNARVMVLTDVLPDELNLGFQDEGGLMVSAINGLPVGSVADVEKAFAQAPAGGFHVLEFRSGQSIRRLVLDAAALPAAEERIKARYGL